MMPAMLLLAGFTLAASDEPERPSELPPLLKVPPAETPAAKGPRGPNGEYEPGYFYLPERSPEGPRRPAACGPDGRIWIGVGLELAWMKAPTAPPLLRLGSAAGPVLYGGQPVTSPMQTGLSLDAGIWMNEARTIGFDASFLYLNATGSDTVIGPVSSATLILPPNFVLADPAAQTLGAFQAGLNTHFSTGDVNSRTNLFCSADARLDTVAGYRYARLADDFEIYGKRLSPGNDIVRFRDEFHTDNQFHGGQVGVVGEWRRGGWFLTGAGKIAFGVVFSDSESEGKFRHDLTVVPTGYFAQPGTQQWSRFAVLPVAELAVGRQIGNHLRLAAGYRFSGLNRVARATDLLEASTSDYWVQSLSLSAEFRY
jgi:hypothetical protein